MCCDSLAPLSDIRNDLSTEVVCLDKVPMCTKTVTISLSQTERVEEIEMVVTE